MVRPKLQPSWILFSAQVALLLLIATLLDPLAVSPQAAPTFLSETVDEIGNNGIHTSIAVDSQDRAHITHYGYVADLKYARRDESGWVIERVDEDATSCGRHSSLVFDDSDSPHVIYQAEQNFSFRLKYARREGQSWIKETIHWYGPPVWTSAEFDAFENLHVSFRVPNDGLIYSRRVLGAWVEEIVSESFAAGGGWYSSLALDAQGNPRIAHSGYLNSPNQALQYAWKASGTWSYEMVDSTGAWGSLQLAADGSPSISYESNGVLMYAKKLRGAWLLSVVDDSVERTGFCTALQLDAFGRPLITYQDGTNGDLRFAWRSNGVWYTTPVDTGGNVGEYTSLALDSRGRSHVSYRDITRDDLKYARTTLFTPIPEADVAQIDHDGIDGGRLRLSKPVSGAGELSAYPNPARSWVSIAYAAANGSFTAIEVYDTVGRRVGRILDGQDLSGAGTVTWDLLDSSGREVAPGTYFLRLTSANGEQATERITVVR